MPGRRATAAKLDVNPTYWPPSLLSWEQQQWVEQYLLDPTEVGNEIHVYICTDPKENNLAIITRGANVTLLTGKGKVIEREDVDMNHNRLQWAHMDPDDSHDLYPRGQRLELMRLDEKYIRKQPERYKCGNYVLLYWRQVKFWNLIFPDGVERNWNEVREPTWWHIDRRNPDQGEYREE